MKRTAFLLTALALAASAHAGLVIDNFDGPTIAVAGPPAVTDAAFGTSSGGFARTVTTTASGNFVDTAINSSTTPGRLSHSQGAGVTGSSAISFAMSDEDLTDGGLANAFRLQLFSVDLNGDLIVSVSDGVNSASKLLTTNAILIANGLALPSYADYVFGDFAGVDFTSVNSVTFTISGLRQDALDATVDNFETVCSNLTSSGGSGTNPGAGTSCTPNQTPEPASLALFGLAALGAAAARRRKA